MIVFRVRASLKLRRILWGPARRTAFVMCVWAIAACGGNGAAISESDAALFDASAIDAAFVTDAQMDGGQVDAGQEQDGGGTGEWIGPSGGQVDLLRFAVFGDVRPHNLDQDSGYPTGIVSQIFSQISSRSPQFVLGVGDWMFASDYDHAANQLDQLLASEQAYSHFVFHALGNHECEGWTTSNCPNGHESGQVLAYFEKLWTFSDKTYVRFDVQTSLGRAKFVIVAPNAWSDAQETWLTQTLDDPTDYTFVVRHEPPSADTAPGVPPSEAIIKSHSDITLILYGHYHEYRRISTNEVISGNGGAPLSTGGFFGYLYVEQLDDGTIQVTEHKKDSDEVQDQFVLMADGTSVP